MAQTHEKWSAEVTEHSDTLDLEPKVFEKASAGAIFKSLKRSAESSDRRKSGAYRSATSMLTFHINGAGRNLPAKRKRTLEAAKGKLREPFGAAVNRSTALPYPRSDRNRPEPSNLRRVVAGTRRVDGIGYECKFSSAIFSRGDRIRRVSRARPTDTGAQT
jgi:Protein of unknown function (DUF3175)